MSSLLYITKALLYVIVLNIVFTIITLAWITDEDVTGLPEESFDKFVSVFFSGVSMFASTSFGDITPKSKRMRIYMSVYMLISFILIKYHV